MRVTCTVDGIELAGDFGSVPSVRGVTTKLDSNPSYSPNRHTLLILFAT
jgi:hypothetical protein